MQFLFSTFYSAFEDIILATHSFDLEFNPKTVFWKMWAK